MAVQVFLAPGPFGAGGQFFDGNGKPLNGGLINTYGAGGSTPTATYTTSAGSVQNANPVVLNSDGTCPSEIWLVAGTAYKFTVTDSLVSFTRTYDNLSGINDPAANTRVLTNVAGTNSITAVGNPAPSAYAKGQFWFLTPAATNTAAAAINISAVGARNIMKRASGGIVATVAGDLVINNTYMISDDGTQLIIEGVRPYSQGANIVAASTINLDTATGDYVHVTGATGITAITLAQGEERTVVFDSTPVLTNGASLVLRNGLTRTAVANEATVFRGEAAGVVREVGPGATKQQTRQVLTTGTAATYTTPSGATRINIRMVGGGGGGAGSGNGGGGTASTWSGVSLSAGGGTGGQNGNAGGAAGTSSNGDINLAGGSGGGSVAVPNRIDCGGCGGNSAFGGGGGGGSGSAGPSAGLAGGTNTGGGGGGGGCTATGTPGSGGGAGGYCEKLITSPASTYTYTVGAAGSAGTSAAQIAAGGLGGTGLIIVDEFYN